MAGNFETITNSASGEASVGDWTELGNLDKLTMTSYYINNLKIVSSGTVMSLNFTRANNAGLGQHHRCVRNRHFLICHLICRQKANIARVQ